MIKVPLGECEGQKLEFKSAAVLSSTHGIDQVVAGVVAMLNAEGGGELWIGVGANNERAARIEPIEEIDAARRRIHDVLIDVVKPEITGDEVRVDPVEVAGHHVIRLTCQGRAERRPYAVQRKGALSFPVRVGARNRMLTWAEVQHAIRNSPAKAEQDADIDSASANRVAEVWEGWRQAHESGLVNFWLATIPAHALELDIGGDRELRTLLREPERSGNSSSYWSVLNGFRDDPKPYRNSLSLGRPTEFHQLFVGRDGLIVYRSQLARLQRPGESSNAIWPFVLLGLVSSFHRLACAVYDHAELPARDRVTALAQIFAPSGVTLFPGSPRDPLFGVAEIRGIGSIAPAEAVRIEDTWPQWPVPASNPDACALRLIKRIYEEFGLSEEDIPREFQLEPARLVLPE